MVPPLSYDTRHQIYNLFVSRRFNMVEICALIPVKVSLAYMKRLCKHLNDPIFAIAYLEGPHHPTGRPQIAHDEQDYFLELQEAHPTFTMRKLYTR